MLQFIYIFRKWTKIGVNLGICLCNNQGNFHLHKFTISENIAKSFRGATFLTHTVCMYVYSFKTVVCCGDEDVDCN